MGEPRRRWIRERGPIAPGLWVMHECDTPRCQNLAHLRLGTAQENTADMIGKGRAQLRRKVRQAPIALSCRMFEESGIAPAELTRRLRGMGVFIASTSVRAWYLDPPPGAPPIRPRDEIRQQVARAIGVPLLALMSACAGDADGVAAYMAAPR